MFEWRGWTFPDGERHIIDVMEKDGFPYVDGKPSFQYRKYLAVREHVKLRRHAVDIGSHIGLWSRNMARDFKHVTAFEPIQECIDCFEKNLPPEYRQRVTLHQVAIGAENKTVEMVVPLTKSSGWTHVKPNGEPGDRRVEMRTLDSFGLTNVDFIKIDVEGYDYFAVKGGEETIRRDRPAIIVEQKEGTKDRYGLEDVAAVKLLESWGYIHEFDYAGDHILRGK